jgi:glycosidase
LSDTALGNVDDQRRDPGSMLNFTRDLLHLRARTTELRTGPYTTVAAPEGAWCWRRGDGVVVVLNLSEQEVAIEDVYGKVLIGTDRGRDGEQVYATVKLRGSEGLVLDVR